MQYIELTRGARAKVCDCHYELANKYKWYYDGRYAHRKQWLKDKKKYVGIRMHQIILKPQKGFDIDHINRDKLDNQCSNLRLITRSENIMNKAIPARNSSGYKGVHWDKGRDKWLAYVRRHGKFYNLGRYEKKEDAVERASHFYTD